MHVVRMWRTPKVSNTLVVDSKTLEGLSRKPLTVFWTRSTQVYGAVVIGGKNSKLQLTCGNLFYGCETWTVERDLEKRDDDFGITPPLRIIGYR